MGSVEDFTMGLYVEEAMEVEAVFMVEDMVEVVEPMEEEVAEDLVEVEAMEEVVVKDLVVVEGWVEVTVVEVMVVAMASECQSISLAVVVFRVVGMGVGVHSGGGGNYGR